MFHSSGMLFCTFEIKKNHDIRNWCNVRAEKLLLFACLGVLLVDWFNFTLIIFCHSVWYCSVAFYFSSILDLVTSLLEIYRCFI